MHSWLDRWRHRRLRRRQIEARRAFEHELALELLRGELYGDLARPMARIFLDMAWEQLALGRVDLALGHLKNASEEDLAADARARRRLLGVRALIEEGKYPAAEARAGELPAGRQGQALIELAIARRDADRARALAAAEPALTPWLEFASRVWASEHQSPAEVAVLTQCALSADSPMLYRMLARFVRGTQ